MVRTNLTATTEVRKIVESAGCYSIVEYNRDISTSPAAAQTSYFAAPVVC